MRTIVFTNSPSDFEKKMTELLAAGWRVTPGTFAAQAVAIRKGEAAGRETVRTDLIFFVELEKVDTAPSI